MNFKVSIDIEPTIENIKELTEKYDITFNLNEYGNMYNLGYYDILIYCCKNYPIENNTYIYTYILDDYINNKIDIKEAKKWIDPLVDIGINIEFESENESILHYVVYYEPKYDDSNVTLTNTINIFDYLISKGANVNKALKLIQEEDTNILFDKLIEYLKAYEDVQTKKIEFD